METVAPVQGSLAIIHNGQPNMICCLLFSLCLIFYSESLRFYIIIGVTIRLLWKYNLRQPYNKQSIMGTDDEDNNSSIITVLTVHDERKLNFSFRQHKRTLTQTLEPSSKFSCNDDDEDEDENDDECCDCKVKDELNDRKSLKDEVDYVSIHNNKGNRRRSANFDLHEFLNKPRKEISNLVVPSEIQVYHLATSNHPREIHGISWNNLKYERYRLMTFVEFPSDLLMSTILLAAKGFAYLGNGSDSSVICCFCTSVLKELENMNYIDQEHKRLKRDCPIVNGVQCGNVSMKSQYPKDVQNFLLKLLSGNRNESLDVTPLDNANSVSENEQHNAVRSSQPSDESASYTIVTNTTDLEEGDSAAQNQSQSSQLMDDSASALQDQTVSVISSPVPNAVDPTTSQTNEGPSMSSTPQENSQQSTETSTSNGTEDPSPGDATSYEKLGIITARPKRPDYAVLATRLNSYNEWPAKHHMRPDDLARAGFFYNGYSDCARCFYCGGGLRNWEPEDNVWVEHARWFSKCAFLLQEVGKDFIEAVQGMSKERDVIKYDDVMERLRLVSSSASPLKYKDKVIEKDPAVLSVIDNGYDRDKVFELALEYRKSGEILSSDKLYELAKSREIPHTDNVNNLGSDSVSIRKGGNEKRDRETVETLRSENGELRQQTTCKICMDMEVAVVFLPCGHFVSCTECSCALTACPLCRVGIKGIVRAYMG